MAKPPGSPVREKEGRNTHNASRVSFHSSKVHNVERTLKPIEEVEFESPTTIDVDARLVSMSPAKPFKGSSPVKPVINTAPIKRHTPKSYAPLSSVACHRISEVQATFEATPSSLQAFIKSLADSKAPNHFPSTTNKLAT